MRDVKPNIAKNLAYFRKKSGMTQAELAEKLNYSDKAISRWEHGDTVPDINVLCAICDFYGIDMNTLLCDDAELSETELPKAEERPSVIYTVCVYILTLAVVWLLATMIFIYSRVATGTYQWMAFIWALPASCVSVMLLRRRLYVGWIFKFINTSIFSWTSILAVFLTFILRGLNIWPLFLIGIPIQVIIIMRYGIRHFKNR